MTKIVEIHIHRIFVCHRGTQLIYVYVNPMCIAVKKWRLSNAPLMLRRCDAATEDKNLFTVDSETGKIWKNPKEGETLANCLRFRGEVGERAVVKKCFSDTFN